MDNAGTFKETKFFLDFRKELEYIKRKNEEGWKLIRIDMGGSYHFEKSQPGEYFTILYGTDKDEASEALAHACRCGFDPVIHTFDGFPNLLYLTAKKGSVSSAEFPYNEESHVKTLEVINKGTKNLIILALCIWLVLGVVTADAFVSYTVDMNWAMLVLGIFLAAVLVLYIVYIVKLILIISKNKKSIQKILTE